MRSEEGGGRSEEGGETVYSSEGREMCKSQKLVVVSSARYFSLE